MSTEESEAKDRLRRVWIESPASHDTGLDAWIIEQLTGEQLAKLADNAEESERQRRERQRLEARAAAAKASP